MNKPNSNTTGKKDQVKSPDGIRKILINSMLFVMIGFANILLKEIVRKTDIYLHYSNYILFEKSNFLPALKFILLKIRSAGSRFFDGTDEVMTGPEVKFTAIPDSSENISSFDGVIERYCGVPP